MDSRWPRVRLVGIVLMSTLVLASCTQSPSPAPSTPATTDTTASASARQGSIPTLELVAPAEGDPLEPGAKLKAGYQVLLSGSTIVSVEETRSTDALQPDSTDFFLHFDPAGAETLAAVTADRVGQPIAFALDGTIVYAPSVMNAIEGGVAVMVAPNAELAQAVRNGVKPLD